MKTKLIFIICILFTGHTFAQKDEVLLTINGQPVYVSEFKRVYEKNLQQIEDEEKNIDKNLNLFINYRLKLLDAYRLKLDTSKTYKRELNLYKNQLMNPYLHDNEFKQKLVRQAYDRTIEEVRVSHILLSFSEKNGEQDSSVIKEKLKMIRERILKGEPFEKLAKEFSDDSSAKINGGDLGYFSAFRMVYQFEEVAYATKTGEVSEPFKTRFGYHILKVTDRRKSRGEFEVAHILVKDSSNTAGKEKIDLLYKKITDGVLFEDIAKKYSNDKSSAGNGGKLPKFGAGKMVLPFENAVLKLKEEGQISKPFKTVFGWHIVKLLKNYPIKSFLELKPELQRKIRTNRGNVSTKKLINSLKKQYNPEENLTLLNAVKEQAEDEKFTAKELDTSILTIKDKKIKLSTFLNYIRNKSYSSLNHLWEKFKDEEILNYYKEDLETIYPEYKNTLQEYKDGLLLFDLMKLKVWDKTQKDTDELEAFFQKNKDIYEVDTIDKVKGKVINDYQKYIETQWVDSLRIANKIKIKKKTVRKIKKTYNQQVK